MTTLRNLLHSFIPSSVISIWVWVPCVPRPGSTKPAPLFCDFVRRTAQIRFSTALAAEFPHPLQNRVPRGERAPVALCREPVSAPASVGAGRSPPGSSTRAGSRDQVLLPLPKKPAKTLDFRRFSFCTCCMGMGFILVQTPGFLTWFYSFPTAATPSSNQNAPGFAFFGLFRARFRVFRPFGRAKFSGWFLCRLPHYRYRIKSLLIPSGPTPYSFSNASYLP